MRAGALSAAARHAVKSFSGLEHYEFLNGGLDSTENNLDETNGVAPQNQEPTESPTAADGATNNENQQTQDNDKTVENEI